MAEHLPNMMYAQDENVRADDVSSNNEDSDDTSDDSSVWSEGSDSIKGCTKLKLPENVAAYIEKRELLRNTETVKCDNGLIEKVMGNYIIAKKILSNLCWQDKLLCKHVCSTWHSAVKALQKEQIAPVDFVIEFQRRAKVCKLRMSGGLNNEPLAVLAFTNLRGCNMTIPCSTVSDSGFLSPCPSSPPCDKEHYLMDILQQQMTAPKKCMLTVIASYLSYMPVPQSVTSIHTVTRHKMFSQPSPFIAGIYIPVIPNVEFHVLNIRHMKRNTIDMEKDFFNVIDKLAQTRIFKGVLVYVTEKFLLLEDVVFLDYIKNVQPGIPYALAGCIVDETMFEQSDINTMIERFNKGDMFVSENFISIGLFSVPKNIDNAGEQMEKYDFEMYSHVIQSSERTKPKIQQAINGFAKSVPQFEHSVALKLSCVGRDQKHDTEQECFRAAFPHTPIVGCYGNGELGINHPALPPPEEPAHTCKRHKRDNTGPVGISYSYATVFMYIGWGKIVSPEGSKT